jgi:hypothetical protein
MAIEQWNWMMDYCKMMLLNPSNNYFWKLAEDQYQILKGKHE